MTADPTPDPEASDYLRRPDARGYLKVLRNWDPIGVLKDPRWPRDEYDSYAAPLVRMLDAGVPRRKIVNWMSRLVTHEMGLGYANRKHTTQCAQELIDFWREWKSDPAPPR